MTSLILISLIFTALLIASITSLNLLRESLSRQVSRPYDGRRLQVIRTVRVRS